MSWLNEFSFVYKTIIELRTKHGIFSDDETILLEKRTDEGVFIVFSSDLTRVFLGEFFDLVDEIVQG